MSASNYSAPPTAIDLANFLETGDFIQVAANADLVTPCGAALKRFEEKTGYAPFLSLPVATERRFDAPGPRPARVTTGYLSSGLVGGGKVLDLRSGIVGAPEKLEVDGQIFVEFEDYFCGPENAPERGKPYTFIEFERPVFSRQRGILINAFWGYCRPEPDGRGFPLDAWQAILQGAAATIFYTLPNNPDVESISRDNLTESFEIASTMTPNQRGQGLEKVFNDAVKLYRRTGF
jgi:hypothetical protein